MRKPILYFSEIDLEFHTGINSKVLGHKKVLEDIFLTNVDIFYLKVGGYNFLGVDYLCNLKIFKYLFLYIFLVKFIYKNNYRIVYMRNPSVGVSFFLAPIFLIFNFFIGVKTIIELPTYPFIYENVFFKRLPLLIFSFVNLNLNTFLRNINFVCSSNNVSWLFRFEKINNYITSSSVTLRKKHLEVINEFNFMGVSNLNFWHGYEKLIRLISVQEGDVAFNFFIFSYSNEYSLKLKSVIAKSEIKNVQIFLDYSFDEMQLYFKKSHAFVDSLNRDKRSKFSNFSLKSRNYASKGLPFISSNNDPIFSNLDFVYEFNDESNLEDILKWYKSISSSPHQISCYSQEKLNIYNDWSKILRKYDIFK